MNAPMSVLAPPPTHGPPASAPAQHAPGQMGLEQFTHSQLAPHLGAGEHLYEYGVFALTEYRGLWPRRYKRAIKVYLAGITPYRIMLIETRPKLFGWINSPPKLENRGLLFHNLNEIDRVRYNGISRLGFSGYKPLHIWFKDGRELEYHIPSSNQVCSSQQMLSTYPARLEYVFSTEPPYPTGQLPAVPSEVIAEWSTRASAAYSKKQLHALGMLVGAPVVTGLLGAMLPVAGMAILILIGLLVMAGASRELFRNYIQRRAVVKAGLP